MSLRQTESQCAECGAPVHSEAVAYCADCDAARDDEDASDLPTVVAPGFGGFARANTDESLEASTPSARQPTPAHPGTRDTLDTRAAQGSPLARPLTWVVVAILAAAVGAAGLLLG